MQSYLIEICFLYRNWQRCKVYHHHHCMFNVRDHRQNADVHSSCWFPLSHLAVWIANMRVFIRWGQFKTSRNWNSDYQYGNTGCPIFKRGVHNWKDFCLKNNILEGNYWILRIGALIWLSKSFSMSKIIRIFFIGEYQFRSTFFVNDIFWWHQILNHFTY